MRVLEVVYPSIYSSNHGKLLDETKKVENVGFRTLHVDIQDHLHASEISFGIKLVKILRAESNMQFDIHLMLCETERYLERLEGLSNVKAVTFHPAGERFPARMARKIMEMGYRVGLGFSLQDPVEEYAFMQDTVSTVLVCTSSADGRGNLYNSYSEEYVRRVRKIFPTQDIVVDGNIHSGNLTAIRNAGATHFVMGREIFDTEDLEKKLQELEVLLNP